MLGVHLIPWRSSHETNVQTSGLAWPSESCCVSVVSLAGPAQRQAGERARTHEAEGGRRRSRLYAACLRRQGPEKSLPERLQGEEECCPGVLRLRLHRWLNARNESFPAESIQAGGRRHPGSGCEYGQSLFKFCFRSTNRSHLPNSR